jgi:hypothetical protein
MAAWPQISIGFNEAERLAFPPIPGGLSRDYSIWLCDAGRRGEPCRTWAASCEKNGFESLRDMMAG